MTIDNNNTALPELPEGYFWRVRESFGQFVSFQIRKRRLLGSSLIVEGVTETWKMDDAHFRWMGRYTLGKFDTRNGGRKYLGDYGS